MLFVLSPQEPFAQPYTDNFESYTVGGSSQFKTRPVDNLVESSRSGEDGEISTAFSSSPTKSVLLMKLAVQLSNSQAGNKTSGAWK